MNAFSWEGVDSATTEVNSAPSSFSSVLLTLFPLQNPSVDPNFLSSLSRMERRYWRFRAKYPGVVSH
jgi:hypothetical protein